VSSEVSRLRRLRRFEWARARSRPVKALAGIAVTALCAGYILWQIDVSKTIDILRSASWGWFLGAIAIMGLSVWPMAWRWQRLLLARGIPDNLTWLVRTYFVSYTAGQVLPTSIGGDAARIYETTKRHPGQGAPVTGSVRRP
jgi:glycosyltransferase 2 family protein